MSEARVTVKQRVWYRCCPRRSRWAVYREVTYRWPDGRCCSESEKVQEYDSREEASREARRLNEELRATSYK